MKWFKEHFLDLVIVLLTVIGLYIGYQIPVSLNLQDSAERLKAERSARFEADIAQINQLVGGPLGEEGSEHMASKRAAARAAVEYAQQGRVYLPGTSVLINYLQREDDAKTHCYLHAAIDRGLSTKPLALGAGARSEQGENLDEAAWTTLIELERAKLTSLTLPTDVADCAAVSQGAVQTSNPQPRTTEFRQYLDVDCQRTNQGTLSIPLDTSLAAQFKIQDATASIEDRSNLKAANAGIQSRNADSAVVNYSIEGLDRQLFGNCPGGGHGTLVVRIQLQPK